MIELLLIFIIGFIIGWIIHARMLFANMLKNPDNIIKLLNQYKDTPDDTPDGKEVVECLVEKESDQYFLYNKVGYQFLIQGPTLESALNNLHEQFPTKYFKGLIPADKAKEWKLSKQE